MLYYILRFIKKKITKGQILSLAKLEHCSCFEANDASSAD